MVFICCKNVLGFSILIVAIILAFSCTNYMYSNKPINDKNIDENIREGDTSLYAMDNIVDVLYSINVPRFFNGEISLEEFIDNTNGTWVYVEVTSVIIIDPSNIVEQIKPPKGCKLFTKPWGKVLFKVHVIDVIQGNRPLIGKDILIGAWNVRYNTDIDKIVFDNDVRPIIPGKRYVVLLYMHSEKVTSTIYYMCHDENGRAYDLREKITVYKKDVYIFNPLIVFVEINNKIYFLG